MRSKSFLTLLISTILLICFIPTPFEAYAHPQILNVIYDECGGSDDTTHTDNIDEMWYTLGRDSVMRHLSHEELTIKYYISDWSVDGEYDWTNAVSPSITYETATELKIAFANSMKNGTTFIFIPMMMMEMLLKTK